MTPPGRIMADSDDASASSDLSLLASYEAQTFTYYTSLNPEAEAADNNDEKGNDVIAVPIRSAVTTVGRNLTTDDGKDSTGLMIWPASHLLCQYLAYSILAAPPSASVKRFSVRYNSAGGEIPEGNTRFPPIGSRILELGCGAGLCGIVASLALSRRRKETDEELRVAAETIDLSRIYELGLSGSDTTDSDADSDAESAGGSVGGGSDGDDRDAAGAVIVCTDGDAEAVELCRENVTRDMFLGQFEEDLEDERLEEDEDEDEDEDGARRVAADSDSEPEPAEFDVRILARTLRWGDARAARAIMKEATAATSNLFSATDLDEDFRASVTVVRSPLDERFDTVMAADVVYPATTGEALNRMFRTVDMALKDDGAFLLAFASRDGHRTPMRLLAAASEAGFKVDCIPEETFMPKRKGGGDGKGESLLPPMLGAKLLVLRRDENAADINGLLGGEGCTIFPGLKAAAEKEDSSEEEWEAPLGSGEKGGQK